jgi:membrane protease YdiL (CAAX protease family)
MQPPEPDLHRTLSRELRTALLVVFGATFVLAIIQAVLPFTASFMQVGLALVLLEVPPWILRKTQPGTPLPDTLRIGPLRPGLTLGLVTSLIVFPIFIVGFHLTYTTLLDRPADWDPARLSRWSEDLEYAPPSPCRPDAASVWTQDDSLWVTAPTASSITLRLATEGTPRVTARTLRCRGQSPIVGPPLEPDATGTYHPPRGVGLHFDLGPADAFDLSIFEQNAPLERVSLGARAVSSDAPVSSTRDLSWILVYLLIHLGLVAWPEEYFFRGYLLPRLDQRYGTPRRLLGVPIGRGLILSALAFALLHPILIPGPHRLLVFFPALLFGWLAARQRHLGAAILVHALSNLCLAIVSRMYA